MYGAQVGRAGGMVMVESRCDGGEDARMATRLAIVYRGSNRQGRHRPVRLGTAAAT